MLKHWTVNPAVMSLILGRSWIFLRRFLVPFFLPYCPIRKSDLALDCQSSGCGFDPRQQMDISEMLLGVFHHTLLPHMSVGGCGRSGLNLWLHHTKDVSNGTSIKTLVWRSALKREKIGCSLSYPHDDVNKCDVIWENLACGRTKRSGSDQSLDFLSHMSICQKHCCCSQ